MTETLSLMMDDIENDDNGENIVLNYFHNLSVINVIQEAIYAAYNFNLHSWLQVEINFLSLEK